MTDNSPPNNSPSTAPSSSEPEPIELAAAPASLTAAQLALFSGWTMAVLSTTVSVPEADGSPALPTLPTVHELNGPKRRKVELGRLYRLLDRLADLLGSPQINAASDEMKKAEGEFADRLSTLHLSVLGVFAAAGLELELAYELGRSLRYTADPRVDPANKDASLRQAIDDLLARGRIAQLQEWLATLSAEFPVDVASIVGASMGRWSDFADVTKGTSVDTAAFAGEMQTYLLRQGDVWLMLLVGARSTAGLLTPEGFVSAGEAALRRSARIVRSVLLHHWLAVVCLAAALGGVLYLAITQLGGASKVWTSIAAIGSTLGVSAQSIKSAIGRLSAEAERPLLGAAEEDAKAWAITTLPKATSLSTLKKRQLRKSGIAQPAGLGRF